MHIDDCICAMIMIFEKIIRGEIVNLGTNTRISVKRIADIICESKGIDDVKYNFIGNFEGRC